MPDSTLTLPTLAALAGVMLVAAAIPSVSVLAVSARAAAHGFAHGASVTLGIVLGDVLFILVAIYGLALLAAALGEHFAWIHYLGGAYLIWLGFGLWRTRSHTGGRVQDGRASLQSGFLSGLLITLGDQKAILFYLGFFPAFVDLAALTPADVAAIVAVAALAVGAPKLVYAFLADRAGAAAGSGRMARALNRVAAVTLCGVGVWLLVKG